MVAVNSGPLLHVNDLPSAVQNHMVNRRAMAVAAAVSATGGFPAPADSDFGTGIASEPLRSNGDFPFSFNDFSSVLNGDSENLAPKAPISARSAHSCPVLPLVEIERRAILHALDYTKGDRMMAANLLGIGRTTLYRKLKEYQIAC